MNDSVYKIFTKSQWDTFQTTGTFAGSQHDIRDGFIHLCSGPQVAKILAKHFDGEPMVILARFCAPRLGPIKWEASSGGERFPHLYGALYIAKIDGYVPRSRQDNGELEIPKYFLGGS